MNYLFQNHHSVHNLVRFNEFYAGRAAAKQAPNIIGYECYKIILKKSLFSKTLFLFGWGDDIICLIYYATYSYSFCTVSRPPYASVSHFVSGLLKPSPTVSFTMNVFEVLPIAAISSFTALLYASY